ncbi:hypothetical protein N0V93_004822 [Gnomoniopsis smithogilvyi]|uniref:ADF-H domain-containing protein n=1 Tax=Gnomoniopsis smithogilvyi TaxID=1191159 RepID=A0A9W9CXF7_9PEZI|nr:hypothetical protein N0V93_004822 [Gnomoniopsis smithogilvyi]
MSLNGLDDANVKEAHEGAVAEAGGWFLLKYASRDEVEVLVRGSNGVVEMRSNIEQYEDPSPLFGFLRYRRRNVLVKFMPEGCSRLIQARSTVHFNAVCDRFGPCETILDLSDPKELNDVKLSNACSLHTASASTSSSNSSLRRRRLMEITEEEEEEQRETKRQSTIEEKDLPGEIDDTPARPRSPITGPPVTLDSSIAASPKESKFADTTEAPSFAGASRPASPTKSFDTELGRRMSSQSSRQDYYSSSAYLSSKARVKLGPRPSADPAGRPRSSGDTKRPVASMPAGLRLLLKGAKKSKTQDDSSSIISEAPSEDTFLASSLAIPENNNNSRPHTSGGRPPSSSGISVKSLPAISAPAKQTMTPEKARLMKALQLREKKKRESTKPTPPVPSIEMTPSALSESDKPTIASMKVPPVVEVTVPHGPELAREAPELVVEETEATHVMADLTDQKQELAADQQSISKADSAIDVVSSSTDQISEHTHTDSRPTSPVCVSEVGDSTKASSVSESTDETLQPAAMQDDSEEKAHRNAETQSIAEEQVADVSTPSAELLTDEVARDISRADDPDAPKAPLTQPDPRPDKDVAEADEKQDAEPTLNDTPAESSFIPTSKFASKLPSGQAAMDPMESRGQDPLNVTNVTSRLGGIDEAGPAPVDTPERTEDGSAASPSKWNLPVSKYSSTHDTSNVLAPSPVPAIVTAPAESSTNGQDAIDTAANKMVDDGTSDEKRRSGRPDPILTSSDIAEKEAPQQNGEAANEQQSATNDDANPSMAVSPMSEFPPQPSEPPTPRMAPVRTVSTPVHSPHSTNGDAPPAATPSRSISSGSAFHQRMGQQPPSSHLAPPRQPGKLGGSLASRIKAFEQLASKAPPSAAPIISSVKDRPSSAFFSVQRNSSIRDGARSPSVLERTNSIYRGRAPTTADSEDSPESVVGRPSRERSGSVASRLSVFEGGNAPRGKPETVQVTARIVREPGQSYPRAPESNVDPLDYASMELKQSPLIVDHRKDVETPEPATAAEAAPIPTPLVHTAGEPRRSLHERRLSRDKRNSIDASKDSLSRPGQRTSLTMARDFFRDSMVGKENTNSARPPSVHLQSSSLLSRLSINTRHKSISQDSALLSPISVAEKSESADEKKEGNRASRLMRRLSSTFSPSRKQSTSTVTSPVLPEENGFDPEKTPQPRAVTAPATPQANNIVAVMGDVNVQFPENLLWKRRTMSLDCNGFLHLSPAQGATSSRERQLKRFHMSEFKTPYTPEMEFQELPNSVCLDFKTGSGLQIALQDRVGQQNVLLVLQHAHQKHTSFGQ